MFSQPIVFVVGAGASSEFRMPLAVQMNTNIARTLKFDRPQDRPFIDAQNLQDMLAIRFGRDAKTYHDAAMELATRIGEFDSINEALQWFSSFGDCCPRKGRYRARNP
jgi:hypothetical protein